MRYSVILAVILISACTNEPTKYLPPDVTQHELKLLDECLQEVTSRLPIGTKVNNMTLERTATGYEMDINGKNTKTDGGLAGFCSAKESLTELTIYGKTDVDMYVKNFNQWRKL